jgi:uncharacterized membrane protein
MVTKLRKFDLIPLATLVCYGASVLPFVPSEVSTVTATVLCLVLTGVALASAIMPRQASGTARLVAIIASSLGTGIFGGIILNYISSGLTRSNWVTYAAAITLIAYVVARVRGAGGLLDRKLRYSPKLIWVGGAKLLASALIVTGAIVISLNSRNYWELPFTEVWLVPDGPTNSPVGATGAVLGIKSHELSDEEFTVVMNTGEHVTTRQVTLAPSHMWTQYFSVEGKKPAASVYRGSSTANPPYRTVWFVRA